MRALCCITMVPIVCPQQFFAESQQLLTSVEACNSSALKIGPISAASDSNSLAAWQYACAHASDVTEVQQQTLQALGCSSRLFMHMAGSSLNPAMTLNSIFASTNLYLMLVRHSAPLTELDRPEGIRQLAETLQQLQKGATPPGTSPLLPCAPLLWLMPAVLLEWAAKQPARGPHFAKQNYLFSMLFWPSVDRVLEQHDCWAHAESEFFEAAGGRTARLEQRQAMLNTMRAMMLDGIPMSSILSASPQTLAAEYNCQANAVTKMYQSASEVAYRFCEAWTPPAVCLAQLLQQVGGAATRMLACMQAAAAADPAGSSSDSSSSGTHSHPGSTKPSSSSSSSSSSNSRTPRGHGNRNSHSRYGDIAPVGSGDDASMLSIALLRLSQSTVALLSLSYRVLWNFVNKAGLATRHDPIWGLRRDGDPNKLDDEEQANLNTLCAAVQETLPQLASLVDAAVRTTVQEELRRGLLAVGSDFLNALLVPGVFVAAGLQPGSPALKPLASLTVTLLKVVGTVQASPAQDPDGVGIAALALRNLLNFSSIVLEVACGANGSSGSGSSAVIAVLTGSKAVSQHKDNTWSAEGLTTISNANKPAPSSSSGNGGSGSGSGSSADDNGSGGIDAVALVPWLVGLGRCCLGCVGTMRCLAGGRYAQEVVDNLDVMSNALQGVSAVLPSWLHSPNVSAQLASAGYVTESLPKLLKSVSQAHQNAAQAGPAALAQVTQELGLALSSLPFGSACNNPLCRELSELSEQQLVVGSARRCSGCRVARYCSKTCQKVHWKQHKPACKAIAAATAPTASA